MNSRTLKTGRLAATRSHRGQRESRPRKMMAKINRPKPTMAQVALAEEARNMSFEERMSLMKGITENNERRRERMVW